MFVHIAATCCAQDWIRTSTPLPALPPQSSMSTNFITWAGKPKSSLMRGVKPVSFRFGSAKVDFF